MNESRYYAHTPNTRGEWHDLRDHLQAVAKTAREFAAGFDAGEWAHLAGLWHDLGKFQLQFQQMLAEAYRGGPKRHVDHSSAGAIHARDLLEPAFDASQGARFVKYLLLLLTATIAGHHAGLPEGPDELRARLDDRKKLLQDILTLGLPPEVLRPIRRLPPLPPSLKNCSHSERRLRAEFLVRMIFSSLVDADRLDTEKHCDAGLPDDRRRSRLRGEWATIAELRSELDASIDRKVSALQVGSMSEVERRVFEYRQAVLGACRQAAAEKPGAFRLDVATGGGKTLSSLSFALRHAEAHGKDRVVVVIPYTSIIEQTASVFREALGRFAGDVVEHHSAVNEDYERADETGDQDLESLRRRLATENWDAPLIVTTAVQFFESLYASTPSRCRKIHNVANSVVIIHEAQTLPPQLMNPTVWVMNELVERYKTTVVLSTATQPALENPFPEIRTVRSIVRQDVARPPSRVRTGMTEPEPILWPALADRLVQHNQVLCITHQRKDAHELALELDKRAGGDPAIHLSAAMCPAHRSEVIAMIRDLLEHGRDCRVISTQLVEAGVDLDFPVVYRSLAGVDSLVQAAGRANREGKRGEGGGQLFVFVPATNPPSGLPRIAADAAKGLFSSAHLDGRPLDLFDANVARLFFRLYFERIDDKDGGITPFRREFRFGEVASAFRFIKDGSASVVIPYDEIAVQALTKIRYAGPGRALVRALQRYTVSLYPSSIRTLLSVGAVEVLLPGNAEQSGGFYSLRDDRRDLYDPRFGLDLSNVGLLPTESYLI